MYYETKPSKNQSKTECFVSTDMQVCKDTPLTKPLNVYFDILHFREQCLGIAGRIKVRLICSYRCLRLMTGCCPPGATLIIKKKSESASGVTRSVRKHALSSVLLHPKGAKTLLTPDDHSSSPESAADNSPLPPSLQLVPCHHSEQSPANATRHNRGDVRGI